MELHNSSSTDVQLKFLRFKPARRAVCVAGRAARLLEALGAADVRADVGLTLTVGASAGRLVGLDEEPYFCWSFYRLVGLVGDSYY